MNLIDHCHRLAERFNREVIGFPIPEKPARLAADRKLFAAAALSEELTEFNKADTLEDEADALIDLIYFCFGRLLEMGITPGPLFEEVHAANMAKQRGSLSKRPGGGYDAIKPEGWKPPDLQPYLQVTRADLLAWWDTEAALENIMMETPVFDMTGDDWGDWDDWSEMAPTIVVLGHARHGKDTVGQIISDTYGLKFNGVSEMVAAKIIMPKIEKLWEDFRGAGGHPAYPEPRVPSYQNAQECFADRANYRAFWYDTIAEFNAEDGAQLARMVFEEQDIYCGIRHKRELNAAKNAGLIDFVVWVDASDRLPLEDHSSISVEPWMADYIIDNNGPEDQLEFNVRQLFDRFFEAGEF